MGPSKPSLSARGVKQLADYGEHLLHLLEGTPLSCTTCGLGRLLPEQVMFTANGLRHFHKQEGWAGEYNYCGGAVVVDEAKVPSCGACGRRQAAREQGDCCASCGGLMEVQR